MTEATVARQDKTELNNAKRSELQRIVRNIEASLSEALSGEFFGKSQKGYLNYSDAQFPLVNFSLTFHVPGNPRFEFRAEVRWIEHGGVSGGSFEDHSKASLLHENGAHLCDIFVPSKIDSTGNYSLDSARLVKSIADNLKMA